MKTFNELVESINEAAAKIKKVVRNNKIIKKKKCKPGFKLVDGVCKLVSGTDKAAKKKSAKKAARSRKGSEHTAIRKRKKSVKKRKSSNL